MRPNVIQPSEKRFRYRLNIAYDGTAYSGWQIQPKDSSIQEIIEMAIATLLKSHHRIVGSGRTDAGVHARQQVAHLATDVCLDANKFLRSMNGLLPEDIRITSVSQVSCQFHAQKSATAKEYHYHISAGPYILPFDRKYAWHLPSRLDITLLREGARLFCGTHDFYTYANESSKGAAAKNSIRTIYDLRVQETTEDPSLLFQAIRLEFYGSGFLYKMVRNITGMLIAVAQGKRPLEDIERSFALRDRKAVERAAPAQGLFLMRVEYPKAYDSIA